MLAYTRTGPIERTPLLFLHGFLGCKEDWQEMIAALGPDYPCITLDLPGFGASPIHPDPIAAIQATLQALAIEKVHLIGYSMGGRLALALQRTRPENIASLHLLSTHLGLTTQKQQDERRAQDAVWIKRFLELPLDEAIALWYAQPLFSTLRLTPTLLKRRLKQNREALLFYLTHFSLADQPLSKPEAHLLYGAKDTKYAQLYKHLPSCILIEGAGHALPLEAPIACADNIKIFNTPTSSN